MVLVTPTGSDDYFIVPTYADSFIIENVKFADCRRGITFTNPSGTATTQGVIRWCSFSPADTAIYMHGQNERITFLGLTFYGGNYGILVTPNSTDYTSFEKNRIQDCVFSGQAANAFSVTAANGGHHGSCDVIGTTFNYISEDGAYVSGPNSAPWVWVDINTEATGGYGQTYVAPTTGSISSGSTSLTVANASGLSIGRTITIQGAGGGYTDLVTVIDNISGTTVTTHDAASTTVSSLEVIQAQYATIYAEGRHILISVDMSGANTNYGYTGGGAYLIGCVGGRPAYQPYGPYFNGGNGIPIRTVIDAGNPYAITVKGSVMLSTDQYAAITNIPAPWGKDTWLLLPDSNGNTTGTYGNLRVRRADASNQDLFRVDGQSGNSGINGSGALCFAIDSFGTGSAALAIFTGTGDPNSQIAAQIGSLYMRQDGGSGTTLYVKESGAGTNTGWVAK